MIVNFTEKMKTFKVNFNESGIGSGDSGVVPYVGSYSVKPKVEAQILPTKEKRMLNDLEIQKIPFFNVGNTAGGSTVYIGGEIE